MTETALAIYLVFLTLAFGLRTVLQKRSTGASGFVGISGRPGSAEWVGGVLFVVALALGLMAPVLALTDAVEPIDALASDAAGIVGAVMAVIGVGLTLGAQSDMGAAWRIGVNPDERTQLVDSGSFALVRNPIFSAMAVVAVGLALMVPSVVAIAGLIALIAAIELQVRVVEEPYLMRTLGPAYRDYAARVGRFVPSIGLLNSST